MQLPNKIREYLIERHAESDSPCNQCNSNCCKGPGFAIFDNVKLIYEKYQKSLLLRSDFEFEKGLSLSQFIFKYFDRAVLNGKLLVFFPKVLSENDELVAIPPWNYWQARDYIFKRKKTFGCIFLNKKKIEGDFSTNYCILHNDSVMTEVTEKPIDCLFLYCKGIRKIVNPSQSESNLWFSTIDYCFPNSNENFYNDFPELRD